jgi:hypothetical protein
MPGYSLLVTFCRHDLPKPGDPPGVLHLILVAIGVGMAVTGLFLGKGGARIACGVALLLFALSMFGMLRKTEITTSRFGRHQYGMCS